jgi:predicted RNA binding protein YcfA (HicA-like mRNA interferase family)
MPISSDEVEAALIKAGWSIRQGSKNHSVAVSPDGKRWTTIPPRRELKRGTLAGIERQTGMKFRKDKRSA